MSGICKGKCFHARALACQVNILSHKLTRANELLLQEKAKVSYFLSFLLSAHIKQRLGPQASEMACTPLEQIATGTQNGSIEELEEGLSYSPSHCQPEQSEVAELQRILDEYQAISDCYKTMSDSIDLRPYLKFMTPPH
jgi:hypothetical protein